MIRWLLVPGATAVAVMAAPDVLWQALFLFTGVAAYAIDIALWPMLPCRRCGGSGKRVGPGGREFGYCRRCEGGKRQFVRLGRRIFASTRTH